MGSPVTSRLSFRSRDGAILPAPPEWAPCSVILDIPESDWETATLTCAGQQLRLYLAKLDGAPAVIADWPRSGAGGYELRLSWPGGEATLATTITPEKLSQEAFEALIDDLQGRLPATVAIALQNAGALAGLELVPPEESTLAEELNRLTRACVGTESRPGLVQVLQSTARGPHRILASVDTWTLRERARRIDATRLHQAFARPTNLTEGLIPIRVPERRVEHTVDVYENRLLRAFHDQVNLRLRALGKAAAAAKSAAVRDQVDRLVFELSRSRSDAAFLDEVSELREPPSRVTMVLLKRSEYRAALEGFIEFRRRALVRLDEPTLAAPLENLPQLYETWATLEAIAAFLDAATAAGYTVTHQRLTTPGDSGLWIRVLPDGVPAVAAVHPDGTTARLIPQKRYRRNAGGLHSASFGKKPDVAIETTTPDGKTAVTILDPKYKLDSETQTTVDPEEADIPKGRPKRQDIDTMHAYRDAIRDEADDRPVRYAAILYPGPTESFGDQVAALQAHPLHARALQETLTAVAGGALEAKQAGLTVETVAT
jgi:hypothetical protein